MDSQIKPFVESFVAALEEYRENYKKQESSINHIRADYMRRFMNKMTDDDTGQPMGDLLLNKTKYELGDKEYDKLTDTEKKSHCDILTLLMQANGQATMALKKLVSRATDTSKKTWLDRFQDTTLDDLIEEIQTKNSSLKSKKDVMAALDRKYQSGANILLNKWTEFQSQILAYEEKADELQDTLEDTKEAVESLLDQDFDKMTKEDFENKTDVQVEATSQIYDSQIVGVSTWLETAEYDGGSMLAFFSRAYDEVRTTDGLRSLYPIVASLSAGQEAGLDFLSITELFSMALSDENTYKDVDDELEEVDAASVYEGVNREIYEKGGVALTSDALRAKALRNEQNSDYEMGTLHIVFWGVTAGFAATTVASAAVMAGLRNKTMGLADTILSAKNNAKTLNQTLLNEQARLKNMKLQLESLDTPVKQPELGDVENLGGLGDVNIDKTSLEQTITDTEQSITKLKDQIARLDNNPEVTEMTMTARSARASSQLAKYLSIGMAVITVIMTVVSTTLTLLDASRFYDTEYAPIPKYMVEEADITTTNEKGETVMLKNETAYYRVVECNRNAGDSDITKKNFEIMETRNDLNGDIGKQWLALYSVKYRGGVPILADSLLYRKADTRIPKGYSTGIHEFGSMAACNLNNKKYLFRDNPPSIKVFFKTEKRTVKEIAGTDKTNRTGSIFGVGTTAMSGGIGLMIGVLLGSMVMGRRRKKTN